VTERRRPSEAEYLSYDGHCRWLWQSLPEDWRCPSCRRRKREILQWRKRIGSNSFGWKAGLHLHHDHAADERGKGGRFPAAIICSACNFADVRAKKVCGAPEWFSFSPSELRSFISAKPNSPVTIRIATALIIWSRHRLTLVADSKGERDDARRHTEGLLGRVLTEPAAGSA